MPGTPGWATSSPSPPRPGLATVTAVMSAGTFSAFSDTRQNDTSLQTQTVFPPLSTGTPAIVSNTVLGVTTLSVTSGGTWATTHPSTVSYKLEWLRCSSSC